MMRAQEQRLSRDDERTLGRMARAGNVAAMQTLVRCNVPFALAQARTFLTPDAPAEELEDLQQSAFLGLARAARNFDPDRAAGRFVTYAKPYIRNAIIRECLQRRQQVQPTQYGYRRGDRVHVRSFDASDDDAGVSAEVYRCGAHDDEDDAAAMVDNVARRDVLLRAAAYLPPRHREIICDRWLIDDDESLGDTGRRYGLGRERIRQIQDEALRWMAWYIAEQHPGITTGIRIHATDKPRQISSRRVRWYLMHRHTDGASARRVADELRADLGLMTDDAADVVRRVVMTRRTA